MKPKTNPKPPPRLKVVRAWALKWDNGYSVYLNERDARDATRHEKVVRVEIREVGR